MWRSFAPFPRWIYIFSLAAIGFILIIFLEVEIIKRDQLVAPLMSVFGTFFGATFAFRLNEDKEARKLNDARKDSLNRALFVIMRQVNAVHNLRKDYEAKTNTFERAFNIPALKPPAYDDLVFNFIELDFILTSKEPNILMELSIEQERFQQALECVRIRNEFYVEQIQPKLASLALNGTIVRPSELGRR
jgi:hypothetical protein